MLSIDSLLYLASCVVVAMDYSLQVSVRCLARGFGAVGICTESESDPSRSTF